jgi:hypothetical protein
MAAQAITAKFALDTNILIDLGAGLPFAEAFVSAYRSQGLRVPPTVVQELTHIAFETSHPASAYALTALTKMRSWGISPFDLVSVGHGMTEINAGKLMKYGILPEGEWNDGFVILETAFAFIPILVSSDNHLLGINNAQLTAALGEFHLPPVNISHPKSLLQAARNRIVPKAQ